MSEELTREEVLHVSNLAKIKIKEEDIKKYQVELKSLLNEVEKINDVEVNDLDILIAPTDVSCSLRDDNKGDMLPVSEVLKNVPNHSGNYIEVPVVINE